MSRSQDTAAVAKWCWRLRRRVQEPEGDADKSVGVGPRRGCGGHGLLGRLVTPPVHARVTASRPARPAGQAHSSASLSVVAPCEHPQLAVAEQPTLEGSAVAGSSRTAWPDEEPRRTVQTSMSARRPASAHRSVTHRVPTRPSHRAEPPTRADTRCAVDQRCATASTSRHRHDSDTTRATASP